MTLRQRQWRSLTLLRLDYEKAAPARHRLNMLHARTIPTVLHSGQDSLLQGVRPDGPFHILSRQFTQRNNAIDCLCLRDGQSVSFKIAMEV